MRRRSKKASVCRAFRVFAALRGGSGTHPACSQEFFARSDGTKSVGGNAHLYSINKISGALISDIELAGVGDIRSTIAYDPDSGRIFFTTADGYLCSAFVDAAAGVISYACADRFQARPTRGRCF